MNSCLPTSSITPLPAFKDNYLWLLDARRTRRGRRSRRRRAGACRRWRSANFDLDAILVDASSRRPCGRRADAAARTGATVYGPAPRGHRRRRCSACRQATEIDGARRTAFRCIEVPGHTAGHIAYFTDDAEPPAVFCGDTLFACGCGRLFEGTPAQMLALARPAGRAARRDPCLLRA